MAEKFRVIEGGRENPLKTDLAYFENEIINTQEWYALMESCDSNVYETALEVSNMSKEGMIDLFRDFVHSFKNGHYIYEIHDAVFINTIYLKLR